MRAMSAPWVRSDPVVEPGGPALLEAWAGDCPAADPRPPASLGIVDGARLPDDRDLDLPGVFELVLDPARDVLREPDRFFVGDLLALDQDADLASGLEGERLRHA